MSSVNATNLVGDTGLLTYSVQFSSAVTNINEMSAIMATYEIASALNLLFRVYRPTYVASNNSAVFGIEIYAPCQFAFLNFFVIYNTLEALNYFEINFKSKNMIT